MLENNHLILPFPDGVLAIFATNAGSKIKYSIVKASELSKGNIIDTLYPPVHPEIFDAEPFEHFKSQYKFKPQCNYSPDCEKCRIKVVINQLYNMDFFQNRMKKMSKPPKRDELIKKIHRQICYTFDFIIHQGKPEFDGFLINNITNRYANIINYIDYNVSSFGYNVTCVLYLETLKWCILNHVNIKPTNSDEQSLLDELKNYINNKITGKDVTTMNEVVLLIETVNKWIDSFPFNLHIDNMIFFKQILHNPLDKRQRITFSTQMEMIKLLVHLTNEAISKTDFYELVKRGVISSENIEDVEFNLWRKEYKLTTNKIANKYETGELEYVETLEKWLAASKKHFEYLKKYLSKPQSKPQTNDTPTTRTNTKKPKPTPKTFADIFINDDWSKYIDVLCEVEPILLKKDDNGKYVFAGNPKKHKGVICSWIKDLQDKNIIHFENRQNLSLVLNAEIKEFNLGKDGKTFDNLSSEYRKNYQNTLLKKVGLLP